MAVNSKALELLGITAHTPQIPGGEIVMESGVPNGVLFDNAMDLVYAAIPAPTKEELKDMLRSASRMLNSYGITSCQSDDYCVFQNTSWETVNEAYRELEEAGELTVNHGKGDKFRVVDFPPFAQAAVLLYLQSGLRPAALPSSAPLFGTTAEHKAACGSTDCGEWHKGSDVWLSECVRRHVLAVTGVDNVRTHDLRHVGARLWLNGGASMEHLQSELGHSSMSTTQIYSGRLQARRGRNAAKEILEDMDKIAAANMTLWEIRQPAAAV